MIQSSFKNKDNLELKTYVLKAKNEKAKIIALHGFVEHFQRYDYEFSFLNDGGYTVLGLDHRGHGASEGERAYVNEFDEFISDLDQYLHLIKDQFEDKPFYFFGHSMGGLILFSYLIKNKFEHPNFRGVVFSAPALVVNPNISPVLQKLSSIISLLAPRLETVPLKIENLSQDPEVAIAHPDDPLNYKGKIKARMGAEMLKQMKWSVKQLHLFDYPFLTMHGDKDEHADISSSQLLFENAKSDDKKLKIWEGMLHEITKEKDKALVMQLMLDWMDSRI